MKQTMMRITFSILILLFFGCNSGNTDLNDSNATVDNGGQNIDNNSTDTNTTATQNDLKIVFEKTSNGVTLKSIIDKEKELIQIPSSIFNVTLRNINDSKEEEIDTSKGWGSIEIQKNENKQTIILKNPQDSSIPSMLKAVVTVTTNGKESQWDLKITGVGEHHSLMNVTFPNISIKASDSDTLFTPTKFGKLRHHLSSTKYTADYLTGAGATMQYMAYYNSDYGIYFGYEDPKASIKRLSATGGNNSLKITSSVDVPNMTLPNNDFEYPGVFRLKMFQGNWYDAAMIYRNWVKEKAEFYPKKDEKRKKRFDTLSNIDVWATEFVWDENHHREFSAELLTDIISHFKEYLGKDINMGMDLDAVFGVPYDNFYPTYIPSQTALKISQNLFDKHQNSIYTNFYTNGCIFDEATTQTDDVPSFDEMKQYATKDRSQNIYTQPWAGHTHAVMCPTQKVWQDTLVTIHKNHLATVKTNKGVYLDQITNLRPRECFDETHGHPLGGGHYWRDGFREMLHKLHNVYPEGYYFVSENFNDSLVDELEGYLTFYYDMPDQVPAVQAVYSDIIDFIGPQPGTGSYYDNSKADSQAFYTITTKAFIYGSILGYYPTSIAYDVSKDQTPNNRRARAADFVKRLSKMKHTLKEYMALGEMKKPLLLKHIPTVSHVTRMEPHENVISPAIENSVWSNKAKSVAVVFVNQQLPHSDPVTFSFDFDGAEYGLKGTLNIRKVTPDSEKNIGEVDNRFTRSVTLKGADVVAYIISGE